MFLEQNSANVCRQVPHGEVNSFSWYATTATASNSRTPCPMAVQMAALSAHTLGPNVPFSTLHPVIISPLFVLSAAPTEKLLYGQYALFRTLMAASTSSCTLASVARRFRGKRVGKSESQNQKGLNKGQRTFPLPRDENSTTDSPSTVPLILLFMFGAFDQVQVQP